METILYWFSGTGNSLVAARGLAQRLEGPVRLAPMTAAMAAGEAPTAPRVGLVFPVYSFGPPAIVLDFVGRLSPARQSYLFAVATNGGMPGRTFAFLRRACARRGLELAASWQVRMPDNCITLFKTPSPRQQQALFAALPGRLDDIAAGIVRRQRGLFQDTPGPLGHLLGALWHVAMPHFRKADAKFRVADSCTRCRLCGRVCPVGNIEMDDGRPRWLHRCTQCLACLQWCPVEAIQYGRRTVGRTRYRHPQVSAEDLCEQHFSM